MSSNKRRTFLASALALLTLAQVPAFAQQTTQQPQQVEFTFRTVEGEEVRSVTLRGNIIVLAFGASWLPLSRAQVQGLQELAEQYRERGVNVFWISTESTSPKSKNYATDEQLRDFGRKYGLKSPVLRDPEGTFSRKSGANQIPAVIIIDREGKVHGTPIGGLDPNTSLADVLGPKLDELLR